MPSRAARWTGQTSSPTTRRQWPTCSGWRSISIPAGGERSAEPADEGRRLALSATARRAAAGRRASSREDAAGCAAEPRRQSHRAPHPAGSSACPASWRARAGIARLHRRRAPASACRASRHRSRCRPARDRSAAGPSKARPASAAGRVRSGRRRSPAAPRSRRDRAANRPGAAAIRRGAGADADRWAGWSAPSRDRSTRPSSRRAPPEGWRAPTATASGDGRSTRPR